MSLKRKDRSANTEEKGSGEARRDDLLWKDLLSRFFVPMLHSLLPELARDIDNKRDVVFLVVEAEATGLRFDVSDQHSIRRLRLRRAGCLLSGGAGPRRQRGLSPQDAPLPGAPGGTLPKARDRWPFSSSRCRKRSPAGPIAGKATGPE